MSANIRRAAFTLAEVLITLGIIGVVAAMTIPTLVSNYKAKTKKFYSMMSQAIQLSEVDNGSALNWTYTGVQYDDDGNIDAEAKKRDARVFYDKYLAKYLKTAKIADISGEVSDKLTVLLNDGSMFTFNNGDCMDFRYDVNGESGPNENGRDIFLFLLCGSEYNRLYHSETPNKAFGGGFIGEDVSTRAKALAACEKNPNYCSLLLELYDNWEFKEDYPYKL